MWLVHAALRRPVTIVVLVLALAAIAAVGIQRMRVDIFPDLGAPTIYVAQPYGGMDPQQMEGFLTYYYEYHFLYITGIEHVESKSIQGAALMKLAFHPGTDMATAMAQVVGYVNRARSFMPPGAVPPFITRFDAGSVPVGQLVFTSAIRTPAEMQDIALNRVRPLFATLPGVSAPPPFGGNQRTIVVRLDPAKLRQFNISPEEAIMAVNKASIVVPSGIVRIGDLSRIANTNAVVGGNLQELADAPVRTGTGPAVYLRDIGVVENGTDIITGYAQVNGRRTVYIPVTKRAEAGSLDVIRRVKEALPAMQAVCPDDVKISLEFDQSNYVSDAIRSLLQEGLLGAALTGLVVLLFLRDWRSALIVVLTIPGALLSAVIGLWISGQTINIMTLGGLALAVGVLVDEATVEIENAHSLMTGGSSRPRAVLDATRRTLTARFLAMLCVLAVFVSSFFMTGVGQQLFVPLSLAVGFAMISSFLLSSTLVPVLSTWIMRQGHAEPGWFVRTQDRYGRAIGQSLNIRGLLVLLYFVITLPAIYFLLPHIGTEIFPQVPVDQFRVRLRAPAGTRIERTEVMELKALDVIRNTVHPENVAISSAFIGVQPASYPINTIYLWTAGPQEAVLTIAVKPESPLHNEALKEELRTRLKHALPDVQISFEAGDIISEVMSFGSPTPVEIAVQGPSLPNNRAFAEKLRQQLAGLTDLRDLQYAQPLDYPTLDITVDRQRAGQYGLTAANVARSLVAATSSSRFIEPNYWRDPTSGNGFQIQVEIPQNQMQSSDAVGALAVGGSGALVSDVAQLKTGTAIGEVERYNMQRVVSLTANIHDRPLGVIAPFLTNAVAKAGTPPKGVTVSIRGQIPALEQTLTGLRRGLLFAMAAIFVLLAAYFQSLRLALTVLATLPAVLTGVLLMLLLTGTTLNIQSFLGAIMAIGIAVANSILLVTFAERHRLTEHTDSLIAAQSAARDRLRAIVMTATAMTVGMIPLALSHGSSAPLGRAVIGGLIAATFTTLIFLPSVYALMQRKATPFTPSLDPTEPESRYYEAHP